MEMELYYVDNASFWWDIKIMFATVGTVLRGKGAK
jgi:lipopolysaccharide/colanic/teichoic acid biosynthesis glycosyltransferase